jgi:HD superfamily phosphodiesterase
MNVDTTFKIDISQLLDFILDASTYYYSVPYHSLRHAADVVTVLYYLCQSHQVVKYLTELDKALLMVAALCHDIGHVRATYYINITFKKAKNLKYILYIYDFFSQA